MKHRGLRGVQVFGFALVEYATTKTYDTTTPVTDRKHHPVAKTVVMFVS